MCVAGTAAQTQGGQALACRHQVAVALGRAQAATLRQRADRQGRCSAARRLQQRGVGNQCRDIVAAFVDEADLPRVGRGADGASGLSAGSAAARHLDGGQSRQQAQRGLHHGGAAAGGDRAGHVPLKAQREGTRHAVVLQLLDFDIGQSLRDLGIGRQAAKARRQGDQGRIGRADGVAVTQFRTQIQHLVQLEVEITLEALQVAAAAQGGAHGVDGLLDLADHIADAAVGILAEQLGQALVEARQLLVSRTAFWRRREGHGGRRCIALAGMGDEHTGHHAVDQHSGAGGGGATGGRGCESDGGGDAVATAAIDDRDG